MAVTALAAVLMAQICATDKPCSKPFAFATFLQLGNSPESGMMFCRQTAGYHERESQDPGQGHISYFCLTPEQYDKLVGFVRS